MLCEGEEFEEVLDDTSSLIPKLIGVDNEAAVSATDRFEDEAFMQYLSWRHRGDSILMCLTVRRGICPGTSVISTGHNAQARFRVAKLALAVSVGTDDRLAGENFLSQCHPLFQELVSDAKRRTRFETQKEVVSERPTSLAAQARLLPHLHIWLAPKGSAHGAGNMSEKPVHELDAAGSENHGSHATQTSHDRQGSEETFVWMACDKPELCIRSGGRFDPLLQYAANLVLSVLGVDRSSAVQCEQVSSDTVNNRLRLHELDVVMRATAVDGDFAGMSALGVGSNVKVRTRVAKLALAAAVAVKHPHRLDGSPRERLFEELVAEASRFCGVGADEPPPPPPWPPGRQQVLPPPPPPPFDEPPGW